MTVQPYTTAFPVASSREELDGKLKADKDPRKLNAHWALPVYPVFKDDNSNGSDKKSVERKIAEKRPARLI